MNCQHTRIQLYSMGWRGWAELNRGGQITITFSVTVFLTWVLHPNKRQERREGHSRNMWMASGATFASKAQSLSSGCAMQSHS